MSWLLDTMVVSESSRVRPDVRVQAWLEDQVDQPLFVSVITFGELQKGLVRLPRGPKKERIEAWLYERMVPTFERYALPVTKEVAERWGEMQGRAEDAGRITPVEDSLIAATAAVHGLTVVTRNVRHFEDCGVPVLNPWERQPPTH